MSIHEKRAKFFTAAAALALIWALAAGGAEAAKSKAQRVDLNSATQKELESLPGVGSATAQKIIAGRPYKSVSDLSRAGVSAETIAKIRNQVTVGRPPASASASEKSGAKAAAREPRKEPASAAAPAKSGSASPVDLNTASEKELEDLPGVGKATAKRIIQNRPYTSIADLSRAKVSAKTIQKISPLVTVSSPAPAARSSASNRPETSSSRPASSGPAAAAPRASESRSTEPSAGAGTAEYQPPPAKGMVWVNLDTKIYHREGDRWYGKTKRGKYMSEADAIKAGYRLSKEKDEPGR